MKPEAIKVEKFYTNGKGVVRKVVNISGGEIYYKVASLVKGKACKEGFVVKKSSFVKWALTECKKDGTPKGKITIDLSKKAPEAVFQAEEKAPVAPTKAPVAKKAKKVKK
jgi:hypothetical protein